MRRRTFITLLGGAASRSASAFAQAPPRVPRIGLLLTGSSAISEAFRQGLSQFGYFEGRSIIIEFRSAGETEELLQHARELVKLEVDLIVAGATPAGRAAQQATKTIPIIVSAMGDPVHDGLVASLSRPGANVTGTTFLGPELVPKRLAFFKELLPNMSRVAILWHPGAYGEHTTSEMRKEVSNAAATLGIQLQFFEAQTPDSIDEALTVVAGTDIEALFQFPSPMLFNMRRRIIDLIADYRLPAMFNAREFVELGGLIGYGANIDDLNRRAAAYVNKILKGAKPSDLPVEQPTKFELVINIRTARTLGVTVSQSLLARADEVIE